MGHYSQGIQLRDGKLEVWSGQVDIDNLPTISGVAPNLYIDGNGKVWKVS